VKWGIKEKRQEKREEERCMERKVHIGNKCWKTVTIYSEGMKITRKRVEDAMKENRKDRILLGGDFNGRIGEREKIQSPGGKCRGEEADEMGERKWMGSIERKQTRGRRRGMDLYR
jgi:hypothetical protein